MRPRVRASGLRWADHRAGGEGTRYARGSPCVRSSLAPFPGAPGYVESRSPGLPRVPRERRVPRAARLRRVRRENTAQVASCPASGLGWADYRAGERRPYAPRAHGLPGSVSPGVKLPPALRGRSRAACSWSSRPGIPALPAGCAPEDRARDGAVLPLSPGPGFRWPGRIPMAEDRPAGFRRCPACPAGGSRSNSAAVSLRGSRSSVVYGALARGHRCLRSLPLRRDVSPHRVRRLHRSRRAPRTRSVRRVARKRRWRSERFDDDLALRASRCRTRAVFRVPRSLWLRECPSWCSVR